MARFKKLAAIALCFALAVSFMPGTTFAADSASFTDMPDSWATASLNRAVSDGLLKGYDTAGGMEIRPEGNLTRAELVTVVNRAFGAKSEASLAGVSDVDASKWFASEMAKAVKMGTMKQDTSMRPNASITRQEAFTILARAFNLKKAGTAEMGKFSDAAQVASWATDSMNALVAGGYVAGSNGKLNPASNITRAEFAKIMDNMVGGYITEEGTVTSLGSGNIIVRASGVTIKDATITGDLILADGVDAGTVKLEGVKVNGRVLVRSGNMAADDNSKLGKIEVLSNGSSVTSKTGTVEVAEGVTGVTFNGKAVTAGTPVAAETAETAETAGGGGGGTSSGSSGSRVENLEITEEGQYTGTFGNVIITGAVGNGEVTLRDMTITGTLTVQGGGSNSIKLYRTSPRTVIMDKDATGVGSEQPRLALIDSTVTNVVINQPAILEATSRDSSIGTVEAKSDVTVKGAATKIETVMVPEAAGNNLYVIVNDAEVRNLHNAKNGAQVTGSAANIGTITAAAPITVGGANNKVANIEVPATAANNTAVTLEGTVKVENIEVNKENTTVTANQEAGGRVGNIVANAPATVEGSGNNVVANVEAKSDVEVAASAVAKITVADEADVVLTGSGSDAVEVAVNTTEQVNVVKNGVNPTFSTNQDELNVTTQATSSDEPQQVTEHICKWEITETPATCEHEGTRTYTCVTSNGDGCPYASTNRQRTETLPPLGHDFSKEQSRTPATCTEAGFVIYACSHEGCNETQRVLLSTLPHSLEHHATKAATCTEDGVKEHWECKACQKLFIDGKAAVETTLDVLKIAATGHTPVAVSAEDATATTPATDAGERCSVCGEVISGCTPHALQPVQNLKYDAATGEISFAKPAKAEDGVEYWVNFANADGYVWWIPESFTEDDFDNGVISIDREDWLGNMIALEDEDLASITKIVVETMRMQDEHVYGVAECSTGTLFRVEGTKLEGSLIKGMSVDNLNDSIYYKLSNGSFNEDSTYLGLITDCEKKTEEESTYYKASFDWALWYNGWRDCSGSEMHLEYEDFFTDAVQERPTGLKIYLREYSIASNGTITVTPRNTALSPYEVLNADYTWDDSFKVPEFDMSSDYQLYFRTTEQQNCAYEFLLEESNQKYWTFGKTWGANEPVVSFNIIDLFSEIGQLYDAPAGEHTFSKASVLTSNRGAWGRVIASSAAIDLPNNWKVTVDKNSTFRIDNRADNIISAHLEMPNALKNALLAETADPIQNGGVVVSLCAKASDWSSTINWTDQLHSDFLDQRNTAELPFVIDPATGTVKIDANSLGMDSDFLDKCIEASVWHLEILVDAGDNITVYMTDVATYGNPSQDLIRDARPISGDKLAY